MRIYVCETQVLAQEVVDLFPASQIVNLGAPPWNGVIVEEINGTTPNKSWDYSGLNRWVVVVQA